MKITIDTKEDNLEDIKKVVKMLQAWIEEHDGVVSAPLSMFSDESKSEASDASGVGGVSEGLFNLFNDENKEEKQEITKDAEKTDDDFPQVIPYD